MWKLVNKQVNKPQKNMLQQRVTGAAIDLKSQFMLIFFQFSGYIPSLL